jgi:hypothetical protein
MVTVIVCFIVGFIVALVSIKRSGAFNSEYGMIIAISGLFGLVIAMACSLPYSGKSSEELLTKSNLTGTAPVMSVSESQSASGPFFMRKTYDTYRIIEGTNDSYQELTILADYTVIRYVDDEETPRLEVWHPSGLAANIAGEFVKDIYVLYLPKGDMETELSVVALQ